MAYARPLLLKPPAVAAARESASSLRLRSRSRSASSAGLRPCARLALRRSLATTSLERGPLYFAGTAEQRLADLHAAFADESTSAVMCLRGGYGSNYLLDGLDSELIGKHPKPFFAYSDLTGMQLRLLDQLGLPAFHGPMLAADFYREDGVHLPSFRAALAGEPYSVGAAEGLRALKPGTARGMLYGGCLSILVSLLGTPWEPHTEGKTAVPGRRGRQALPGGPHVVATAPRRQARRRPRNRLRRNARLRLARRRAGVCSKMRFSAHSTASTGPSPSACAAATSRGKM